MQYARSIRLPERDQHGRRRQLADRADARPHHRRACTERATRDTESIEQRRARFKVGVYPTDLFEHKPIIRFAFDFKIGSDANSILGYRFDDKPGHDSVPSRILLGYTIIVIEDGAAVAQFTQELASSKSLVVRIRSLNAGRTVADFQTDGGKAAIDAVLANCPATAGPVRDKRAKS
jgi:hypothetical protein